MRPWIFRHASTTSGVSESCGMTRGGTKLPTSISFTPAAAIALIQRTFASVVIRVLASTVFLPGPLTLRDPLGRFNTEEVRQPRRATETEKLRFNLASVALRGP